MLWSVLDQIWHMLWGSWHSTCRSQGDITGRQPRESFGTSNQPRIYISPFKQEQDIKVISSQGTVMQTGQAYEETRKSTSGYFFTLAGRCHRVVIKEAAFSLSFKC